MDQQNMPSGIFRQQNRPPRQLSSCIPQGMIKDTNNVVGQKVLQCFQLIIHSPVNLILTYGTKNDSSIQEQKKEVSQVNYGEKYSHISEDRANTHIKII